MDSVHFKDLGLCFACPRVDFNVSALGPWDTIWALFRDSA